MRINFTEKNHKEIADLYIVKEEDEKEALNNFSLNANFGIVPKYLYLMKLQNHDLYKIGITNDIKKRQKQLQTGNPFFINYIFVVEADLNDYFGREINYLEKFLHKNFEEQRVHREWFKLSKIDVCKIFLFLNTSIYARDLPDVIPGTGLLKDVLENCKL